MISYQSLLLVFLGGGIGSVLRYMLGRFSAAWLNSSMLGTFAANVIASIIFGVAMGVIYSKIEVSAQVRFFILTGICGGLSTFSTFNFELYEYFKSQQVLLAFGYMTLSVIASLGSMSLVIYLMQKN